jgi:type III secretory pathway component EscR
MEICIETVFLEKFDSLLTLVPSHSIHEIFRGNKAGMVFDVIPEIVMDIVISPIRFQNIECNHFNSLFLSVYIYNIAKPYKFVNPILTNLMIQFPNNTGYTAK